MTRIEELLTLIAAIVDPEAGILVQGATFTGDNLTIDLTSTNALLTTIDADTGAIKIADEAIQAAIEGAVQTALDAIKTATEALQTAAEGNMQTALDDLVTAIKGAVQTALDAIKTATEALQTAAEGNMQTALDTLVADIAIIKAELSSGYVVESNETIDGTSAADQSAAIENGAVDPVWVLLASATNVYYAIGADPTATADDSLLTAGSMLKLKVASGEKISALGGKLSITILS